MKKNIKHLFLGTVFGIILTKSEVISWFRIQEMFRFESFHMYGIIGTAVVIGIISIQIIKRFKIKNANGEQVNLSDKKWHKGALIGGFTFGLGWAITGACPGPLFALLGSGYFVIVVTILSALLGTYVYGRFKEKLPH